MHSELRPYAAQAVTEAGGEFNGRFGGAVLTLPPIEIFAGLTMNVRRCILDTQSRAHRIHVVTSF
jgi:hypothetical protein